MSKLHDVLSTIYATRDHDKRAGKPDHFHAMLAHVIGKKVRLVADHADSSRFRAYCEQPLYDAADKKLPPAQLAANRIEEDRLAKLLGIERLERYPAGTELEVAHAHRGGYFTLFTGRLHHDEHGVPSRCTTRVHARELELVGDVPDFLPDEHKATLRG